MVFIDKFQLIKILNVYAIMAPEFPECGWVEGGGDWWVGGWLSHGWKC